MKTPEIGWYTAEGFGIRSTMTQPWAEWTRSPYVTADDIPWFWSQVALFVALTWVKEQRRDADWWAFLRLVHDGKTP